jgi:hypothetical protein
LSIFTTYGDEPMTHKLPSARSAPALVLALALSCSGHAFAQTSPKMKDAGIVNPKTVLNVGNSFFYFNNRMHRYVGGLVAAADPQSGHDLCVAVRQVSGGPSLLRRAGCENRGLPSGNRVGNRQGVPGQVALKNWLYAAGKAVRRGFQS